MSGRLQMVSFVILRSWTPIQLDNFRERSRLHVELPGVGFIGPLTEVGTRRRIDNEEPPRRFKDVCRFREGLARVNESPNPSEITARWEPQWDVSLGVTWIASWRRCLRGRGSRSFCGSIKPREGRAQDGA